MKTIRVVLGEREFEIREQPRKAARKWRAALEEQFGDLAEVLEGSPDINLRDGKGLGSLVATVSRKALGSVDIIADLLAEYAPELPLDEAYDSEVMEAFVGVLGLAYPFGAIVEKIRSAVG